MGSSINMDELKELERGLGRKKTFREIKIIFIFYTIIAFILFILFFI